MKLFLIAKIRFWFGIRRMADYIYHFAHAHGVKAFNEALARGYGETDEEATGEPPA